MAKRWPAEVTITRCASGRFHLVSRSRRWRGRIRPWVASCDPLVGGIFPFERALGLAPQRVDRWPHQLELPPPQRVALRLALLLRDPVAGLAQGSPGLIPLLEPVPVHGDEEPVQGVELTLLGFHLVK